MIIDLFHLCTALISITQIVPFYSEFLPYKHPQVGFEPPLINDTIYEADTLPTKPPWPDSLHYTVKIRGRLETV